MLWNQIIQEFSYSNGHIFKHYDKFVNKKIKNKSSTIEIVIYYLNEQVISVIIEIKSANLCLMKKITICSIAYQ